MQTWSLLGECLKEQFITDTSTSLGTSNHWLMIFPLARAMFVTLYFISLDI